jgi:uncharacterized MAPEG superfamily protein
MTLDMKYLVWAVGLTLVQMLVSVIGATLKVGLPPLVGNREGLAPPEGWAGRARRAHFNMLESLVLFAILVLVAGATGHSNSATALGAQIFFWSRLAYAVIYVVGIPWLRTVAWAAAIFGLMLIFRQVV